MSLSDLYEKMKIYGAFGNFLSIMGKGVVLHALMCAPFLVSSNVLDFEDSRLCVSLSAGQKITQNHLNLEES